jgi:glutamate--cysteine ligase
MCCAWARPSAPDTTQPPKKRALTPDLKNDHILGSRDDLLRVFHEAIKPAAEWRVGAEMEKFGVDSQTGAPIHYDGPRGVLAILGYLAEKHGWAPEREKEGGPIIALLRSGASITLEPGSQLELSGAPNRTIHEICTEFRQHLKELEPISKELGLTWLGLGFHPFATRADLKFVPKLRYAIMKDYLPTRGGHALDMMLRTCTVQANFDYASEADALKKVRVATRLAPLTTALFANSPFYEGKRHEGVTYRGRVWLDVDPDRSGLVPAMWSPNATFDTWVEWALDCPMFMVKRDGQVIKNTGQTFRSFWKDGFEGHKAMYSDWQTHLNTLFPEVRLKKTIEVRGADSQGSPLACALPALFTGILYDERALDEALALTDSFQHDEVHKLRDQVWRHGIRAQFRGAPLADLAEKVLTIAEGGLERRGHKRTDGKDERVHLAKLKKLVEERKSPADVVAAGLTGEGEPWRREIIARADLTKT